MKIMLFDETPERSLFLRMTLERLGHEIVAEVADSRQLYDAVRSHSPDANLQTDFSSKKTATFPSSFHFYSQLCDSSIVY
jgi:CheY-like chemotaxis protein